MDHIEKFSVKIVHTSGIKVRRFKVKLWKYLLTIQLIIMKKIKISTRKIKITFRPRGGTLQFY